MARSRAVSTVWVQNWMFPLAGARSSMRPRAWYLVRARSYMYGLYVWAVRRTYGWRLPIRFVSLCRVGTRFRSLIARGLSHCSSPVAFADLQGNSRPVGRKVSLPAQDEPVSREGWGRIRRAGQRVQFGGHVGGFGRADPLQDRQRVP